jgi:hypothetical protein
MSLTQQKLKRPQESVYNTPILSVLLHGNETWKMKDKNKWIHHVGIMQKRL